MPALDHLLHKKITRRQFIRLSGKTLLGAVLTANALPLLRGKAHASAASSALAGEAVAGEFVAGGKA